jgi:tRNA-dihydrouridine synthase B
MLMRKYAACYAQGLPGARHFRGAISMAMSRDDFYDVVERHFPR